MSAAMARSVPLLGALTLGREPSRIARGLADILGLEVRIFGQQVGGRRSCGDPRQQQGNRGWPDQVRP